MKIEKITLMGSRIKLVPLAEHHLPALAEVIDDGKLWELPYTFVPHPNKLPEFFSIAESGMLAHHELAFATIDLATNTVVGSTRFRNIEHQHKRVEIGSTFIAKSWQRTHVNTEAKYLMLRHAFEFWGINRVEFRTDFINTRSRNAIARIGGREEGVLRNHMIMRDGRVRDTVIFSIIDSEWASVKQALELKLSEAFAEPAEAVKFGAA